MSSGGTRSVIHFDADHNLHCLVAGRKDFIMIAREHFEHLSFHEKVDKIASQLYVCCDKVNKWKIADYQDQSVSVVSQNHITCKKVKTIPPHHPVSSCPLLDGWFAGSCSCSQLHTLLRMIFFSQ